MGRVHESGAQKRKKKLIAADAAAGLPTGAANVDGSLDTGKWAADYQEAGTPNLDDPSTDLDYVRRLQLVALRQMATTPFPSQAQQNCWRRIREMSAVVGMTSNRAKLEAQVKKLKKTLADRALLSTGAKVVPGKDFPKPPTARGRRPPGPRPLPPETPEPPNPSAE